jgi:hypothetical protein
MFRVFKFRVIRGDERLLGVFGVVRGYFDVVIR